MLRKQDMPLLLCLIFSFTGCFKHADAAHLELALLAAGADPNARADNGMTARMFAAWENHTDISRVLLKRRADPDIRDRDAWTALMGADFKGHADIVDALTEPRRHIKY